MVMRRNSHHVVPAPSGGWAVKKGGATRASKIFDTKKAAENYARKVSENQSSELVIHRRDGTIERKDFHAVPPRGRG